jgi:hypothetical protein
LDLTPERFPFAQEKGEIKMNSADLFLKLKARLKYDDGKPLIFELKIGKKGFPILKFITVASPVKELPHAQPFDKPESLGKWTMTLKESVIEKLPSIFFVTVKINGVSHTRLNPEAVEDMFIICEYSLPPK